jgi:hypothetical protein
LVAGESLVIPTMRPGLETVFEYPGLMKTQAPGGDQYNFGRHEHPRRLVRMDFTTTTQANFDLLRDKLFRATRGGALPFVLIPDDTKSEVLFGRLDSDWRTTRQFRTFDESSLSFREEPVPRTFEV